jgi:hypothetical protein
LGWWLSQSLEIFGLALGLAAGTWFQWGLLTLFLLNETELRKDGGPCVHSCFICWLPEEWQFLPGLQVDMDSGKKDLFFFTTG